MKIGIISDTHSWLDAGAVPHLAACDEIWHAGDIGNTETVEKLMELNSVRAVYGNIDGGRLRKDFKEVEVFEIEEVKVLLIHIANKPPRYTPQVRELIEQHRPKILVCGHSHILRVLNDKENNLLFINPGAAGRSGFQKVRTIITFHISKGRIYNLNVIELGPRTIKA